MKKCIIISALGEKTFTSEQIERLKICSNVTFLQEKRLLNDIDLINILKDYEIAAITRRIRKDISKEIFLDLPLLKGLAIFSTGYEWIDTEYLNKKNVKIAYLPDYSTVSVAEHAMGLLLSALHRIHLSYDFSRGMLTKDVSLRGFELSGKKAGIIGFGRIGQKVYSLLSGFGVNVKYYDIDAKKKVLDIQKYEDFDSLLANKDILLLCASKARNEKPIISDQEISKMKDNIIIINPARADLVDNSAIIKAINSGKIFTYAVDEKTDSFKSVQNGRVIETGHTAWYSTESIKRGIESWVANIEGLCTGKYINLAVENI